MTGEGVDKGFCVYNINELVVPSHCSFALCGNWFNCSELVKTVIMNSKNLSQNNLLYNSVLFAKNSIMLIKH